MIAMSRKLFTLLVRFVRWHIRETRRKPTQEELEWNQTFSF